MCNKPNVVGRARALSRNAILIQSASEWGIKRTGVRGEKKATSSLHNKRTTAVLPPASLSSRPFFPVFSSRSYLCRFVPLRQPARPSATRAKREISLPPWVFFHARRCHSCPLLARASLSVSSYFFAPISLGASLPSFTDSAGTGEWSKRKGTIARDVMEVICEIGISQSRVARKKDAGARGNFTESNVAQKEGGK